MLSLTDLLLYPGLRAVSFESAECAVQRFILFYDHTWHSSSLPSDHITLNGFIIMLLHNKRDYTYSHQSSQQFFNENIHTMHPVITISAKPRACRGPHDSRRLSFLRRPELRGDLRPDTFGLPVRRPKVKADQSSSPKDSASGGGRFPLRIRAMFCLRLR